MERKWGVALDEGGTIIMGVDKVVVVAEGGDTNQPTIREVVVEEELWRGLYVHT